MATQSTTHHAHHDPRQHPTDVGTHGEHHIVPLPVYYKVFSALMVLLIVTLLAAAFDLGQWNLPIAMAIAVAKALVVMVYFMHLKWSGVLVRLFSGAAFFWLLILFVFTLADYLSRGWVPLAGR